MRALRPTHRHIDGVMIGIASVLLLGIVLLTAGHSTGNRLELYAGAMITLAGVFTGIQRLVIQGKS